MGQEIGVTSLQILSMVSAVANGRHFVSSLRRQESSRSTAGVISETEAPGSASDFGRDCATTPGHAGSGCDGRHGQRFELDGYRAAARRVRPKKLMNMAVTGRTNMSLHSWVMPRRRIRVWPSSSSLTNRPAAYYGAQIAAPYLQKRLPNKFFDINPWLGRAIVCAGVQGG